MLVGLREVCSSLSSVELLFHTPSLGTCLQSNLVNCLLKGSFIIKFHLCTYLGYSSPPTEQSGSSDKNDLRKRVESLFNDLYSKYNSVNVQIL